MTKTYFYENPKDRRIVKIDLREIEALASGMGDLRAAESMDDEAFYSYCDVISAMQTVESLLE